jgi:hypothetical protein
MEPRSVPTDWPSAFENDPAVIYALNGDFRLTYCNAAWDRFAAGNGGTDDLLRDRQIGRSVLDVTPPPLRLFYAALFAGALESTAGINHIYECSSAEIQRKFHMHLHRIDEPGPGPLLLVTNSLILETPHQSPAADPHESLRQPGGLITMCAHCRRTLVPDSKGLWVWIPDLVRRMPREISHGLCDVCYQVHYGKFIRKQIPHRSSSQI